MVNTPNNSTERIPSNNGGNKFKKGIAALIALTLYGQPSEGKTYEKQEFPTEMVANNPGEVSPMTENVEQSIVPNYINRAQNGVRKYYPQYEEYFNQIFTKISGLKTSSHNLINNKIDENFELFSEEITSEKDKITTILLVLEKIIIGKNQLEKSINGNVKGRGLIEIAEGISDEITEQAKINHKQAQQQREQAQQQHDKIRKRNNKLDEIINYINTNEINKETISIILGKIEEYFTLFEISEIKKEKGLQKIIERYITYTKKINKTPSNTGKKFIEEYIRINSN